MSTERLPDEDPDWHAPLKVIIHDGGAWFDGEQLIGWLRARARDYQFASVTTAGYRDGEDHLPGYDLGKVIELHTLIGQVAGMVAAALAHEDECPGHGGPRYIDGGE